jgi:hypothetical protein
VFLAAGCGGEEHRPAPLLPAAVAADLAARSDSVAARLEEQDDCGARSEAQRLQSDAIAAVNAGRVPHAFQEELLASVNALVEAIECVPPPPATEEEDEEKEAEEKDDEKDDEGRGKGKDEKKGKGKGEKKRKGKD